MFAERVRGALESVRLQQGSLTVSAGIAACHPSMRSSDELIAAADLALYRAKGDGRNCVRIFGRPHDESEEDMPGEGVDGGSADRVRRQSDRVWAREPIWEAKRRSTTPHLSRTTVSRQRCRSLGLWSSGTLIGQTRSLGSRTTPIRSREQQE